MREDLSKALLPSSGEKIDPVEMARRDLKKSLPKRFYKEAGVAPQGEGFALVLDGRPALTPARNRLAVPSQGLAQAMAAEWGAQGEFIEPSSMPVTRIVNSALDGVASQMEAVSAEVAKYAESDLLCYRAGTPQNLVAEQAAAWDPVLAWAREAHGARFILAEGVMYVTQPEPSVAAVRKAIDKAVGEDRAAPLRLAALHTVTTLTGSALLALALAQRHLTPGEAWRIAHVDEDFQMHTWGEDMEGLARRAQRWTQMEAAGRMLQFLGEGGR
jgi:chaperone required for assembly of F1-ATPase